jgi:ATP-dependent helicase HrpA
VEHSVGGRTVRGYPALVDDGETVAVRVLPSAAEQRRAMAAGLRRMLLLGVGSPNKAVVGGMSNAAKLALSQNPHGSVAALLEDCTAAALDAIVAEAGGPVWSGEGFATLQTRVRTQLPGRTSAVLAAVRPVLEAAQAVRLALAGVTAEPADDVGAQLGALVHPGFVAETGQARLVDVVRYLKGAQRRLESLPGSAPRDRVGMVVLGRVQAERTALVAALPPERRDDPDVLELGWMEQELRISLFAQTLRTPYPISEKRIYAALDAVPR